MKKCLPALLYTIGICFISALISSTLYYFNITSDKINTIFIYLIGIISLFVGTFIIGKKTNKKAIIAGSIYFSVFFSVMLILSFLIFKLPFKPSSIIYYIILYMFSILGTVIGKNNKKETGI